MNRVIRGMGAGSIFAAAGAFVFAGCGSAHEPLFVDDPSPEAGAASSSVSDGGAAGTPRGESGAATTQGGAAGHHGKAQAGAGNTNDGGAPPAIAGAGGGSGGSAGLGLLGLKVAGTKIVEPDGQSFLLRGLGVGELFNVESYMLNVDTPDVKGLNPSKLRTLLVNAMGDSDTQQFFARWEANLVTQSDVQLWASWGVNSIRLPINYHSLSAARGSYSEDGFKKIDAFVAWCKAAKIYVILDLHAAPGAQNNEQMSDCPDGIARLWTEPDTYQPWTIELWQTIAKRYANIPAVGGYDLFDEPILPKGRTVKDDLRPFYLKLTAAIRAVDTQHILFVEGTNWSSDPGFDELEPAWDTNLVWAFHKYWDKNDAASIKPYLALRERTQRPIWNGETGENDDKWNAAMIALCEQNEIGWNMWTYKKVADTTEPYAIAAPANYGIMKAYLEGGATPSATDARTVMLSLADNAATGKCVYNSGYVHAVFGK